MPDTDPAREVLRDIPPELAIDCALRWREQRDEAITQRDQVAHERDALRKELDALRASRPASLGDKAREALRLAKVFHAEAHNKVGDFRDWECIKAKFYAALDSLTDADLAPDPVWVECVEACMAYAADWGDGDPIVSSWGRCIEAGRAARAAKGGA